MACVSLSSARERVEMVEKGGKGWRDTDHRLLAARAGQPAEGSDAGPAS